MKLGSRIFMPAALFAFLNGNVAKRVLIFIIALSEEGFYTDWPLSVSEQV